MWLKPRMLELSEDNIIFNTLVANKKLLVISRIWNELFIEISWIWNELFRLSFLNFILKVSRLTVEMLHRETMLHTFRLCNFIGHLCLYKYPHPLNQFINGNFPVYSPKLRTGGLASYNSLTKALDSHHFTGTQ